MARTEIYAGICGFTTEVEAVSDDRRHVKLTVRSQCPDVLRISKELNAETFDAFEEIGPCKQAESIYNTRIMTICGRLPHVACPVPSGIAKAIEIAAGLALPRDARIRVLADKDAEGASEDSGAQAP
jgi:hypothetical protein